MILRSGAETLRRRPRKFPPWLLDRGARVVIESGRPIARTVPVPAGGSAPAVAGLVDQRRRERRLIQKAPADSATRTRSIPPSARRRTAASSQAVPSTMRVTRRCVVAPAARASADIQEREAAVSCTDL